MSEPLWQPRTDRAARWLGLGFLLGGAAMIAFQIKVIVDAADARAVHLHWFMAALALGEMGIVLGLWCIVRGLAGYTAVRALPSHPRGKRWLMIVSAVVIGATMLGVKAWLRSLGYDD